MKSVWWSLLSSREAEIFVWKVDFMTISVTGEDTFLHDIPHF